MVKSIVKQKHILSLGRMVDMGFFNKISGILVDSTGLDNASQMSITQLNNHNGELGMEVRLIYVIGRLNGMPLYFRYCPGNIVDVSTLCTTIAELSQYGDPD